MEYYINSCTVNSYDHCIWQASSYLSMLNQHYEKKLSIRVPL